MILPGLLVYVVLRMTRMSPLLRASNEGLLETARCASTGDSPGHPPLLAGFFSILLVASFTRA